jgi:hypothetical protein
VHRDVQGDCIKCHQEHKGADSELRPFDQAKFDHAAVARFPLEGKHAVTADKCANCHKMRSFLTLNPGCVSCHADGHKPTLGQDCASCHSIRVAFKDTGTRFDHSKAAFQLLGPHQAVACAKCHVNQVFRGLTFGTCSDCHRDPHRSAFGATCTTCHNAVDGWYTKKVDHARTAFPLIGRHADELCAACHKQGPLKVKLKAEVCSDCHTDVHKGTFKQDCKACHSETGFEKTPFDHAKTSFALTGKHSNVACTTCHQSMVLAGLPAARRVADFRGLKTNCLSCHQDVHQGQLGIACESCHSPAGFKIASYTHERPVEFFGGKHAPVACEKCHVRQAPVRPARTGVSLLNVTFKGLAMTCVTCHTDVHQTQLGGTCETCHSTTGFKIGSYTHQRPTDFFAGQHAPVACDKCHVRQTPSQPARTGVSVLDVTFKGLPTTCVSCHTDVHLGQEGIDCHVCHSPKAAKFALAGFSHERTGFALTGRHERLACEKCHKRETGTFPAGVGTAVRLKGSALECRGCHEDVHLGQVDNSCDNCHTTQAFKVLQYKHRGKSVSRFFVGRHLGAKCQDCHRSVTGQFPKGWGTALQFKLDTRCAACHKDFHNGSLGPNCGDCHRLALGVPLQPEGGPFGLGRAGDGLAQSDRS